MTPKEKAASGLQLLKDAILELLRQPESRPGMRPFQVRDALGLVTGENEGTGVATSILKLMAADGELETIGDYQPLYAIPGNRDSGQQQPN